jgi:hypothetical protein
VPLIETDDVDSAGREEPREEPAAAKDHRIRAAVGCTIETIVGTNAEGQNGGT